MAGVVGFGAIAALARISSGTSFAAETEAGAGFRSVHIDRDEVRLGPPSGIINRPRRKVVQSIGRTPRKGEWRGLILADHDVIHQELHLSHRAVIIGCIDLDTLPGAYDLAAWSVDRLHPSELGHRMLATAFAGELELAGCAIETPVSLECAGGAMDPNGSH
jgi:hypothetical protein